MFDIGASELLLIVVVAVIVIGPKDLPLAMRTAGRWIAKVRRVSGHFRAGIDAMVREAELEDMEKKWREQNDAIMKEHPPVPDEDMGAPPAASAEAALTRKAEPEAMTEPHKPEAEKAEPQLPLPPP
ncbi:MAG: twin-arginine translocase subunit TatB [Novosphingobium sp.]|nr:twin-arginine translocase subunit TatB [Novosphingobium sp.]